MMTITELVRQYVAREISPVEVMTAYLRRIEERQDLAAFITVDAERALAQAAIAEQRYLVGEATGRLEGVPVSYKDVIHTRGIRTTDGSLINRDFVPAEDAAVVTRLQREGAVNGGKTNLHELLIGVTSSNPHFGAVRNPWNTDYTPGGSSGGSAAAVAANISMVSIGTDTGGSIRIPSSSCGVVGLKPTYGYIDKSGVTKNSWTLDHVGPIARNVADLAITLEAMSGDAYPIDATGDIRGLRVGVPRRYFNEHLDADVKALYDAAVANLAALGCILVDIDLPFSAAESHIMMKAASAEAGYLHRDDVALRADALGPDLLRIFRSGGDISAFEYIEALEEKARLQGLFADLMSTVDVVVTPTLPATAQPIGQDVVTIDGVEESVLDCMVRYVAVFNLTEQPALSIPCGTASNGLPVGLQIAAASRREDLLLRVASAYERSFLDDFYQLRDQTCASPFEI
jgi:aspartyl-tRNA(Asn)/glutamyl-tRNA(Gln) amidotransferase subunit A